MFRNYSTKIKYNYKLLTNRKYSNLRNFENKNEFKQNKNQIISILTILAVTSGFEIFNYYNQNIHNESIKLKENNKMIININELMLHNKPNDCWVSINGHVYDITDFIDLHPGGADKLLKFAGKDATKGFRMQHNEGYLDRFLGNEKYRGELSVPEKTKKKNKREGLKYDKKEEGKYNISNNNNNNNNNNNENNVKVIKTKGKIIKIYKCGNGEIEYQDIISKYDKYYKKENKENKVKIKLI